MLILFNPYYTYIRSECRLLKLRDSIVLVLGAEVLLAKSNLATVHHKVIL